MIAILIGSPPGPLSFQMHSLLILIQPDCNRHLNILLIMVLIYSGSHLHEHFHLVSDQCS